MAKKRFLTKTLISGGMLISVIFIVISGFAIYRYYELLIEINKYDVTEIKKNNGSTRLAQYWLYAKYNPFFAIPGSDLSKVKENIDFNDQILLSVIPLFPREQQSLIWETLYPTDFLREITRLEEVRINFINNPDKITAEIYHEQLLSTISSYQSSMADTISVFGNLGAHTIGFMAGTTSAPTVKKRLVLINKNIDELLKIEEERFKCLSLTLQSCIGLTGFKKDVTVDDSTFTKSVISSETLDNKNILDTFYTKNTASSTLIVLEESLCYPKEGQAVFAYWEEINDLLPNIRFIRATPAEDLFLHDLSKSPDNALYRSLLDAGLTYRLQPLNQYLCIDGGSEYQKLTSIKKIYDLSGTIPITERKNLPKHLIDLFKTTPNKNEDAGILYESRIRQYVSILNEIFTTYTEKELLGYVDEDTYQTWRDISLLWRTKSADLDIWINTLAYLTETNRETLELIEIPLEPLYLTRSYISMLYLLGNETIHQEPYSLLSSPQLQSLDSFNMVSANELFVTKMERAELRKLLLENKTLFPTKTILFPEDQPINQSFPI